MATGTSPDEAIARVVESATRLGVELDEREAAEWVAAMETEASGGELVVDVDTGVYGHRVTMLDFQPEDLARFREMATIVGFEDRPPQVLTALSISGLGGPEQDQRLPGRLRLLRARPHPGRHARGGVRDPRRPHPREGARHGRRADPSAVGGQVRVASGRGDEGRQPGRRRVADVVDAGGGPGRPDGGHPRPTARCASTPGRTRRTTRAGASSTGSSPTRPAASWPTPATCSTRPGRRRTARSCRSTASSTRTSRRSTSRPTRSRSSRSSSRSCRPTRSTTTSSTLEHEVWKYTVKEPNYGKAARRMYNVFRMNGRYREAAYIRELFDEPVTALYQVSALIRTLDDAASLGRHLRHRHDGRPGATG